MFNIFRWFTDSTILNDAILTAAHLAVQKKISEKNLSEEETVLVNQIVTEVFSVIRQKLEE